MRIWSPTSSMPRSPVVRSPTTADRPAIEAVLRATNAFTDEETRVALELVDHTIGRTDDYRALVVELPGGEIAGYACYGPTPLAEGVYDLYWIAVDPRHQGHGVGRLLVASVERAVATAGGRMLLVETASKPSYAATRAFYERTGWVEVARVPDFYRPGDDKIIYAKTPS